MIGNRTLRIFKKATKINLSGNVCIDETYEKKERKLHENFDDSPADGQFELRIRFEGFQRVKSFARFCR
jgi:hypothetical protein